MPSELRIVSVHTGGWIDSESSAPGRMEDAAGRARGDDLADLAALLEQGWSVEASLGMAFYGDKRGRLEVAKLLMRRDG